MSTRMGLFLTKLFERTLEGLENGTKLDTVEAVRLASDFTEYMARFSPDDPVIVKGVGAAMQWAWPILQEMATASLEFKAGRVTRQVAAAMFAKAEAQIAKQAAEANQKPLASPAFSTLVTDAVMTSYAPPLTEVPVDTGRLPSPISSIMTRPGGLTDTDIDVIDDLLRDYKKIQAIKIFREATRLGLKESKEWVEDRMKLLGVPDIRQPTPLSELAVFEKVPDQPTRTATPFSGTCSSCDIRRHFSTEGWHKCETTDCNGSIFATRTTTSEPIAPASKGG